MVLQGYRSAPHIPPGMKTPVLLVRRLAGPSSYRRSNPATFFDIVNGFLIDAVAHWCVVQGPHPYAALTDVVHLAEIIRPHL
jgi:hypothetical protein